MAVLTAGFIVGIARIPAPVGKRRERPPVRSSVAVEQDPKAPTVIRDPAPVAPPGVLIPEPPPPPRRDEPPPQPSANHVWVGGYWYWNGRTFVWIAGGWVARPRPNAVGVSGHWDRRDAGYFWIPGTWR
ncbi:MAG TPA: hypothetical protein VE981_20475 [Planctomycetota bacterium]|nr:hypothetical protein [Planctomycetota bacterium]